MWSSGSYRSWGDGVSSRSDGRPSSVADGKLSGVAEVSWLERLKTGLRVAPLSIILLSAEDFTLVTRVAIPIDATTNVMELVEVSPNISITRLVDFLVDIRVGIAWRLPEVGNVVTSRPLWR